MLRTRFNEEEFGFFTIHEQTPLHYASEEGHLETVKYLIERGADVNSIWCPESLEYRMNVFTLINNFNDPFYQRYENEERITKSQINILIENGMI